MWALCQEEVICQIGFHSLLGLRAACQPGRLTLSDSPACKAHMHIHTNACGEVLKQSRVSEARRSFRLEHMPQLQTQLFIIVHFNCLSNMSGNIFLLFHYLFVFTKNESLSSVSSLPVNANSLIFNLFLTPALI